MGLRSELELDVFGERIYLRTIYIEAEIVATAPISPTVVADRDCKSTQT
jgi:hypothetical protein